MASAPWLRERLASQFDNWLFLLAGSMGFGGLALMLDWVKDRLTDPTWKPDDWLLVGLATFMLFASVGLVSWLFAGNRRRLTLVRRMENVMLDFPALVSKDHPSGLLALYKTCLAKDAIPASVREDWASVASGWKGLRHYRTFIDMAGRLKIRSSPFHLAILHEQFQGAWLEVDRLHTLIRLLLSATGPAFSPTEQAQYQAFLRRYQTWSAEFNFVNKDVALEYLLRFLRGEEVVAHDLPD